MTKREEMLEQCIERQFDIITTLRADLAAHKAAVAEADLRVRIQHALLDTLGDAYDCTRVWQAWGVGTMDQDDFVPVLDRMEELIDEIAAQVTAPLRAPIEEHGWLIEHEDEPKWLTLRPAEASWSACWTKESSDAVRFCRRSDAEDYVSAHFGGEGPIRITDHIWTGAKP